MFLFFLLCLMIAAGALPSAVSANTCGNQGWQAHQTCSFSKREHHVPPIAETTDAKPQAQEPQTEPQQATLINAEPTRAMPTTTVTPEIASASNTNNQQPITNNQEVTTLKTVTVTATRTKRDSFNIPGSVTVIDAKDPATAAATDYKSLLDDVPGVEFQGSARRNGQVPVIRGFDGDSILVLVDGVRQNFQSQHDGQFFVDPELLKQVEVVRGPGSALYGSGGLGGVISFTTVDARDLLKPGQNVGAKLSTGYQSVNSEYLGSATAYGRDEEFDVLANILYRQSGDIDLGNDTTLASEDTIRSGLLKLGWYANENHTFRFQYNGLFNGATEPNNPQIPSAPPTNALVEKDIRSQTVKLSHEYNPENPWIDLNSQVYHTNTNVEELIIENSDSNNVGDVLDRELKTTGLNIDNQSRFTAGESIDNTLSYGVEYFQNTQDGKNTGAFDGERAGAPDAEADFFGIYAQDEIAFADPTYGEFLIIPGLRYDYYSSESDGGESQENSAFSPKLGATYKPVPWFMVFGNTARAFRAPNLTELYPNGTHFTVGPFENRFIPNPDLKPEKSLNFEAGFGFQFANLLERNDSWRLKFSRYRTVAEDLIDANITAPSVSVACFLPNPPPGTVCSGGSTQNVNIPEAIIRGYDIEAAYEDELLRLALTYTYMNGKNSDTGAYITNIIPVTFKSNLAFKFPEYNTMLGWRGTFVQEHDKVNQSTATRDGYSVHDVYLRYEPDFKPLDTLTVDVGVDNVFDKAYETVFAGSFETGRNYKIRVGYTW